MTPVRLFSAFFLFIVSLHLFAGEVVIRKILDSNLFELKGGQKIKLAYIDAPSITDPDPQIRAFARTVRRYAMKVLLRQSVEIEYVSDLDDPEGIRPVRLWKKYPLQTIDFIKKYLEQGFGKLAERPGLSIDPAYRKAGQKAREKQRGVWNPHLHEPAPPNIFATNLMVGLSEDDGADKPLVKEILLNTKLLTNRGGFGVRLTTAYGQYTREYSEPQNGVLYYILNFYGIISEKYVGFEPGIFYLHIPYERKYRNLVLPSARLKVGDLQKIYLSLDFLTDLYSLFSIGMNVESHQSRYYKIWVGLTPISLVTSEHRWSAAIKTEVGISERLLLRVQALRIDDRYDPTRYGFRMGVGFRFPVGRRNTGF